MLQEKNAYLDWVQFVGNDKFQAFQDSFAATFGISLCFLNADGKALTVWSNYPLFCHLVSKKNKDRCLLNENNLRNMTITNKKITVTKCYMGVTIFMVPIILNGEIIALAYGGGVVFEDELTTDIESFDLTVISKEKFRNMLDLLSSSLSIMAENSLKTEPKNEHLSNKQLFFLRKNLSLREIEIVDLINNGCSNKEIADVLNISDKTVKTHITNILRKLQLKDRLQIILFCKDNQTSK